VVRAIARRRWLLGFDSSQCGIYGEQIDAHANFSPGTWGLVPFIIPPIFHTHFQFASTLVRRTSGRSLGTSKESNVIWDIGDYYIEKWNVIVLTSSKHWWNVTGRAGLKFSKKNPYHFHFIDEKSHMDPSGIESRPLL